jgi:hypothetical protein
VHDRPQPLYVPCVRPCRVLTTSPFVALRVTI